MKKNNLLLCLLAVTTISVACGSGGPKTSETTAALETEISTTATETTEEVTEETTTEEETTEPETEAPLETVPIGEVAMLNNWNITVDEVQIMQSVPDNYGKFDAGEGNQYLLVSVSVSNEGKEAGIFLKSFGLSDDVSTLVIYGDGYEFSPTMLLGYSKSMVDSSINPLSSKSGDIAFEIPDSVADTTDELILQFTAGNSELNFKIR